MSRTIRVYWAARNSGWVNFNWNGVIDGGSVVHISACESKHINPGGISHDYSFPKKVGEERVRGDATIYVKNIRPHDEGGGGVEFFLQVDWNTPLPVITDISVLDPPAEGDRGAFLVV